MEIQAKTLENDEEYLRKISTEVDFNDKSYLDDVKLLEKFCIANEVFAMAAVQIGIPKRIIYLKSTSPDIEQLKDENYNEARVLINPKIIARKGKTKYWEACRSCGNLTGLVQRPYLIEVEYYDIEGNIQKEIFEGFESTVLSHEYDHLDGLLHIDIAEEVLTMTRDERNEFRKNHPYEIIDKECEYDNKSLVKIKKKEGMNNGL